MPKFLAENWTHYRDSDLQVAAGGSVGTGSGVKLVVVAGQNGVEQDTCNSSHSQTGQVDGDAANGKANAAHRVEAQCTHQNDGGNDQVAAVGEVHAILHHVAHTDGRDHAVQHKADTADDAGGDGVDDGLKLGAEAQDDSQHSGNADDQRVIDLAQCQHAGVLAVGGVSGTAQQTGHGSGQTIAHQGAVQAGVIDIVVADSGADGGDIANVLHHGSQCDGDDSEQSTDELRAAVNGEQTHRLLVQGDAQPSGLGDLLEVHCAGDQCHSVGDQHADEDGQDLDHALAPDVAHDDSAQCHKGQQPVGLAVGDGRGCKDQADGDDDGAGDHRREELHDAADTKGGDQQAGHQIDQTRERNGSAGIGQHLGVGNGQVAISISQHGSHDGEAAQICKGRAEECRDLLFGNEVEQQGAQTGTQQRGGNAQAGEQRHQNRCAEHGKHVLHTQNEHPASAKLFGVIYALGVIDLFAHRKPPVLLFPKKEALPLKQQCL